MKKLVMLFITVIVVGCDWGKSGCSDCLCDTGCCNSGVCTTDSCNCHCKSK